MTRVLVDAGPLIAIFSAYEEHHVACREALQGIETPLRSCWPVVAEAAWVLRARSQAVHRLLHSIGTGWLHLLPIEDGEVERILRILQRYENLHAQLADAALVYLAEREGIDTIFTLDRRDFSVYRTSHNRRLRILPGLPH